MVPQTGQLLGKRARINQPTHRGNRHPRWRGAEPSAKETLWCVRDVHRRIVINTEVVEWLLHRGKIIIGHEWRKVGGDRDWISAVNQRIEASAVPHRIKSIGCVEIVYAVR